MGTLPANGHKDIFCYIFQVRSLRMPMCALAYTHGKERERQTESTHRRSRAHAHARAHIPTPHSRDSREEAHSGRITGKLPCPGRLTCP